MTKFYGCLFAISLIFIIFSSNISRFVGDMMTVMTAGVILALFSGTGVLLEKYKK